MTPANGGAWPAARPLLLKRRNPGRRGHAGFSGQVCCRQPTWTVIVFSPPWRCTQGKGLISVSWAANCFQATPPGNLQDRSLCDLGGVSSPQPMCLSGHRSRPNSAGASTTGRAQLCSHAAAEGRTDHLPRSGPSVPEPTRRYGEMAPGCKLPAHPTVGWRPPGRHLRAAFTFSSHSYVNGASVNKSTKPFSHKLRRSPHQPLKIIAQTISLDSFHWK